MFLFIDTYSMDIHSYEQKKFYDSLNTIPDFQVPESAEELLEKLQIPPDKPSYYERQGTEIYIIYHLCGHLLDYKKTLEASMEGLNLQYEDGLHPLIFLKDGSRGYFTEAIDYREPQLPLPSFQFHLFVRDRL